jgi:elongator complex protein 3
MPLGTSCPICLGNPLSRRKAIRFIIDRLAAGRRDLPALKNEAAGLFSLGKTAKNSEIMPLLPKGSAKGVRTLLFRKPIRTASGVTPIAVMVRPSGSCKFSCIYCPTSSIAPKSYTGLEPAARRARASSFDPKKQVKTRLMQYRIQGHPADKCEIIAMGGTFLRMPEPYKHSFVKGIYDALNGRKSKNIADAQRINGRSRHRVVGFTFETRPDVCSLDDIREMLLFGATRVELGVQNPDDSIYMRINRGHTVDDVVSATAKLKDSALKVAYHLMPGLPGSSPAKDALMARKIFSDPRFRPDMLKIYPTLVMSGTKLFKMQEKGEYSPYSTEEAADTISEMYRRIPYYARVMRIQRDIPTDAISSGVQNSNLRQMVEAMALEKGIEIREIRFREPRSAAMRRKPRLFREDYAASNGRESFLSFESSNRDTIYGFVRLRIPHAPFMGQIDNSTALIRELHVYGPEAEIGNPGKIQHRGLGARLLKEAEEIASKEFGMERMVIMPGVGARDYYYKRGYKPELPYVSKRL